MGKAAFTYYTLCFPSVHLSDISPRESRNNGNPTFAVSPPAGEAEFRSVYIAHTDPATSEWGCVAGVKWRIFDQNDDGVVLYPVHDACIFFMQKMAHLNLQSAKPGSLAKHTSLKSYYETLIRVHERLTEFPHEDQEQYLFEPWHVNYGYSKLEWDHGYYGAARFADGSTWYMEPGWEVSKYPQGPRSGPNLTDVKSGSAPTSSTSPDSRPTSCVTYSPFKIWVFLDNLKVNTV